MSFITDCRRDSTIMWCGFLGFVFCLLSFVFFFPFLVFYLLLPNLSPNGNGNVFWAGRSYDFTHPWLRYFERGLVDGRMRGEGKGGGSRVYRDTLKVLRYHDVLFI